MVSRPKSIRAILLGTAAASLSAPLPVTLRRRDRALPAPRANGAVFAHIGTTCSRVKSGLPQAHSSASWRPERSHRHPRRCRFWARWDLRRRRIDTHHGSFWRKRRHSQFHTTALCSPTRAALLTGRNHHSVGTGVIIEMGTGFPGYTGIVPNTTAGLTQILRQMGYATAASANGTTLTAGHRKHLGLRVLLWLHER